MKMWKGETLHGDERKLTRAQLETIDRICAAVLEVRAATGGKGAEWAKMREALGTAGR